MALGQELPDMDACGVERTADGRWIYHPERVAGARLNPNTPTRTPEGSYVRGRSENIESGIPSSAPPERERFLEWRDDVQKRLLRELRAYFPNARGYPLVPREELSLRDFAASSLLLVLPNSPVGVGYRQVRYLISYCVAQHLFRHLPSPVTSVGVHDRLWSKSHIRPENYSGRGRASVARSAKR